MEVELQAHNSDERRLQRTSAGALASAYPAAAGVLIFGHLAAGSSAPSYRLLTAVSLLVFFWALATHWHLRGHVNLRPKRPVPPGGARTPARSSILYAFTPEAWQNFPVYSGTLMIASYAGCVGLMVVVVSAGTPAALGETALGYFAAAGLSLCLHEPARWAFRRQQLGLESST